MTLRELLHSPRRGGVAVIGSGYVGTVVAACLATVGHDVIGVESDPRRLATLATGLAPVREPGLDELLGAAYSSGKLRFTGDMREGLEGSNVVFLCVGTPPGADGHADMSAVQAAATEIGRSLRSRHVLVTKSTVPIGSGHWLASVIEDAYRGATPVDELVSVVSCPEFLREGSAVDDFLHPERVVLGSDDPVALEAVADVYGPILDQSFPGGDRQRPPQLLRTGLVTAEMVKYAANAFLATKISFVNEIANICECVGADVMDVAAAIGMDSRIGSKFLQPGIGWGGSCFGKDLSELVATATDHGHEPALLKATVEVNTRQRRMVLGKLRHHLKTLRGRRICLLGLAFKPGTDDLRDAPSVDIARLLVAAGATVTAHDPVVERVGAVPEMFVTPSVRAAATRADALVVLTDWPDFADLDVDTLRSVVRNPVVIDGRNALDPAAWAAAGFVYEGVGRSARAGVAEPHDGCDGAGAVRPMRPAEARPGSPTLSGTR